MLLAAPAGYGKTTLLSQWASADRRRFGWVTLDRPDSDPVRLAEHVAFALGGMGALDHMEELTSGVLRGLATGNASAHGLALPHLLASLCRPSQPGVLVLDDVHELVDVDAMNFIEALASRVPPGFHIAIGARLGLSVARLRSEGRFLELGLNDLAFTGVEIRRFSRWQVSPAPDKRWPRSSSSPKAGRWGCTCLRSRSGLHPVRSCAFNCGHLAGRSGVGDPSMASFTASTGTTRSRPPLPPPAHCPAASPALGGARGSAPLRR